MMDKKSIRDIDVKGKQVLIRVDFNVPLKNGQVGDDTRIQAALPTIQHVLDQGGCVVLLSHLGRPKGKRDPEASLKPTADALSRHLGRDVGFVDDCIGEEVEKRVKGLQAGDVLLLENVRFYPEEEGKAKVSDDAGEQEKKEAKEAMKASQEAFAQKLAQYGEVYVNDAFGSAHRAHASVYHVAKAFGDRAVAGFLLEKELDYLGKAVENPDRPFVAILGGAKVSDKINVISNLLKKVDTLIIGGAMAYTFYLAQGHEVGDSKVEEDKVDLARDLLQQAEDAGVALVLPKDNVVADDFSESAQHKVVPAGAIEKGWTGVDIGPETIDHFRRILADARTVVWNGPMGAFELEPFAKGTYEVAEAIAEADCSSIIGGGDSASAVNQSGYGERMSHISTGGGASLELLEGLELPGVAALADR